MCPIVADSRANLMHTHTKISDKDTLTHAPYTDTKDITTNIKYRKWMTIMEYMHCSIKLYL